MKFTIDLKSVTIGFFAAANTDATNSGWRSGNFQNTHTVVKPTKDRNL